MRTRRSNNTTGNKGKKKDRQSTSSPDIVDSPVNGTTVQKGRASPGTVSTCSSSSTDRDSKLKTTSKERLASGRKRLNNSETEDEKLSKKKKSQERSDSDSLSDSSSNDDEDEIEADAELEEVNQDDLSSSSPPTTPSPIDNDFKLQKDCIKPEPQLPVQSPSHHPLLYTPVSENHLSLPQRQSPVSVVSHPVPLVPVSHVEGANSPAPIAQESTPKQELHPSVSTPSTVPPLHPTPGPPLSLPAIQPLPSTHPPPPSTITSSSSSIPPSFQPVYNSSLSQSTHSVPPPLVPSQQTSNPTPRVPDLIPIKKEPASPPRARTWEETINKTVESSDLTSQHQLDIKPPPFSMNIDTRIDPERIRMPIKVEERDVPPSFLQSPAPVRTSTPNPTPTSIPVHPTQPTIEGPGLTPNVVTETEHSLPEHSRPEPEVVQIDRDDDTSDDDRDGTLTPGPDPTPCSKEIHRSKAAIFIQILNRGANNSCSRCDLVFRPTPNSSLAKKREDRERKSTQPSSTQPSREEKPPSKRTETPPRSHSVDAHIPSSHSQSTPYTERHTPRALYTDTPALRQLSEYARPHALGSQDVPPPRSVPYTVGSMSLPQQMDPMMSYRLAMYPPGSRERLELELERDKRERDARERDLRERELRDMELREKMKAEMEMKPPGLDRLVPHGTNPLDPHWLEIQRRYGYPPGASLVPATAGGASTSAGHIPGVYPPASLASDLMAREREKLDRLGLPPHALGALSHRDQVILQNEMERVSAAERLHAERLMLASADPVLRMQMGLAAANNAAMHAHTHTHAHSHTHLHLHPDNPTGTTPSSATAGSSSSLHPLITPHLYPQLGPGADPMSGVPGSSSAAAAAAMAASGAQGYAALSSLSHGMSPHGILPGSREELLQRELFSRAHMDPALAHQLSAQAAVHHDAIQRQLALERDRYGNAGHLPH